MQSCHTRRMKNLIAALLLSVLPLVAHADQPKLNQFTTQEVNTKLKSKNFYVFDNNAKDRFQKSHVPGAHWVDPTTIKAADLPADKTATLVFYCGNTHCTACHIGAQAALQLG